MLLAGGDGVHCFKDLNKIVLIKPKLDIRGTLNAISLATYGRIVVVLYEEALMLLD